METNANILGDKLSCIYKKTRAQIDLSLSIFFLAWVET